MNTETNRKGWHIPSTISKEAQEFLRLLPCPVAEPPSPASDDLAGWREAFDTNEKTFQQDNDAAIETYRPQITSKEIAGIPVLDIRPREWADNGKVIIYAHGGAYTLYSAQSTLMSAVPVAEDTGFRVISVDYTRAPFAKWTQVTDEVIAVVAGLQEEGYLLSDMVMYGDSAGGSLVASSVLKMRDAGMGMPATVVLWSPWADITDAGDTYHTMVEAEPCYRYEEHLVQCAEAYADPKDQRHPYVSPVYGDFTKGFPPTLIQGGTKEIFLSNFVRLYQALDNAGVSVKLDLYEGMIHVFQAFAPDLPESKLARKKFRNFISEHCS